MCISLLITLICTLIFTCLVLAWVSLFELSYQLSCPFIFHLILVIYFLYFPAPEACPVIGWISVQTRLYSTHGKKLWTSMTLSCLVRSLTQTRLAASLLPRSQTRTHLCTLTLGTQTLTRIGYTERLSGLHCSHARLLADRDKPLFHSLTHPHRYTYTCKHLASTTGVT